MRECGYVTTGDSGAAGVCGGETCRQTADMRIKCRTYGAVTIPEGTEAGAVFPLVNLNVDTGDYKKPCIKLEFFSNILTDTATATLNFQVLRQCSGQLSPVPAGSVWTFSRAVATADEGNSFGFALCDCDGCSCGCCNYSVVVTVAGAATTGTVTVNNATLVATVVETDDC